MTLLPTSSVFWLCLIFILAGCKPTPTPVVATSTRAVKAVEPTSTPSAAPAPSSTPTRVRPTQTASPTQTPSPTPGPMVCSPFDGIGLHKLESIITNPFLPPRLGSDDPHQGVDFSDVDPVYQIAVAGKPVHAVLGGTVASTIHDQFPYGNAIMIETPLELLPSDLVTSLQLPTPAPTVQGHPVLYCPETEVPADWDSNHRSLYLIYAHLKDPPGFHLGEVVDCGHLLNAIGDTGNALNPHLHLELRVGPSGAVFPGMAHYTTSASEDEMGAYCFWRVSGTFQLLDPMALFSSP